jgi:hypothetical protein
VKKEGGLRFYYGEFDDEFCAFGSIVFNVDLPMMLKNDRMDNGETKAGPVLVFCKVGIENLFSVFTGNAFAGIGKFQNDSVPGFLMPCKNADGSSLSPEP